MSKKILDVLTSELKNIADGKSALLDLRKKRGVNHYAEEISRPGVFDKIFELRKRGATWGVIFGFFRGAGLFTHNYKSDVSSFYKAVEREAKRCGIDIHRSVQDKTAKKDEPPAAQGQSEHPHPSAIKSATTDSRVVKEKTFNIIEGDDVL